VAEYVQVGDRPILTVGLLSRWLAELFRVPHGLLQAYVPGSGGIDARTREQLIIAVSDVDGCRYSAWVHGSWLDFLGARDPDEVLAPLFEYARSCAEAGRPLDTTTLEAVYPPAVVSSVRATVARTALVDLVGNTFDDLIERLFGHQPFRIGAVARDAAVVATAVPFLAPVVATAGLMRLAARLAPPLPPIALPPEDQSNLVVHMVADAAPTYLGHTLLRTSVLWSPVPIAIAVRIEGSSATLRVGRGRISVSEGIEPDALVVLDGGVEPLLRVVASSIVRELSNPRPLRRRS
jgi:AhpD family alkylhydroperoxidase